MVWQLASQCCCCCCCCCLKRCAPGAIYAGGDSNVTVIGSVLNDNYVKDYDNAADGGACYLDSNATLSLVNTTLRNNTAQNLGGAVAMGTSR